MLYKIMLSEKEICEMMIAINHSIKFRNKHYSENKAIEDQNILECIKDYLISEITTKKLTRE